MKYIRFCLGRKGKKSGTKENTWSVHSILIKLQILNQKQKQKQTNEETENFKEN